ncbi:hypothetical protein J6590_098042 [Homalodisca vitripennis]|nr:hypothetical protein J6590_098042 [Homalodisca vitripennis]
MSRSGKSLTENVEILGCKCKELNFPSIHCEQTSGIELMYGEISTMTSCLKAGNSPARANG